MGMFELKALNGNVRGSARNVPRRLKTLCRERSILSPDRSFSNPRSSHPLANYQLDPNWFLIWIGEGLNVPLRRTNVKRNDLYNADDASSICLRLDWAFVTFWNRFDRVEVGWQACRKLTMNDVWTSLNKRDVNTPRLDWACQTLSRSDNHDGCMRPTSLIYIMLSLFISFIFILYLWQLCHCKSCYPFGGKNKSIDASLKIFMSLVFMLWILFSFMETIKTMTVKVL